MEHTVSLFDDIRKMKLKAIERIKGILPAVSEGIQEDLKSKMKINIEVSKSTDNSGVVETVLVGKKEYPTADELKAGKTSAEDYIKDLDAAKITEMVKTYGSL